ncbi:MAG: PSD1 and planctomycete cytochrome C domain-containing protein, partial [Planctomycetota bacterium JB042]
MVGRASRLVLRTFLGFSLGGPAASAGEADGVAWFERDIRPLLAERCTKCHGERRQRSGLRLDSRAAILAGGERGPAVVPGDPDASLLVRAVRRLDEDLAMPPRGALDPDEVRRLEEWVRAGAPGPDDAVEADVPVGFDLEARKAHWAFRPLADPEVPEVADRGWGRSPIDAFVLARLEAAGLRPAPEASRREWVRRVTFDLTGLPPTPAEVAAYVDDSSDGADERVVDRLLASPSFAERWARHWLDLVGYAETRGHEYDFPLPNAWQYRDWVIRAIAADVPFDRFLREQIAGDLIEPPRRHPTEGFDESILGTGFWLLGEEVHSPVSTRADRMERVAGRIDALSRGFLGLSVACARCHDHKFDAISARDFYALAGFAEGATYAQVRFETLEDDRAAGRALERAQTDGRDAARAAAARGFAAGVLEIERFVREARAVRDAGILDGAEALFEGDEAPSVRLAGARERLRASIAARAAEAGVDPAGLAAWTTAVDALPESAVEGVDLGDAAVRVDYRVPGETPLWQNGVSFRATAAGEVLVGGRAERPARRVSTFGAARFDPAWRVVERHPDSEADPGQPDWPQAGVTLKTPTFRLRSGRLWLLVEGAGHVYAAVDKHRMISPPLHARLVKGFGPSDEFRWVEHDLTPYAGHRVHLELSPRLDGEGGGDFAVAMIAEGEEPPTLRRTGTGLAADASPERVRAAFAAAFDAFASARDGAVERRLVDWWLTRSGRAFDVPEGGSGASGGAAAAEARRIAAASIRPRSRLAPAVLDGSGVDEDLLTRGDPRTPAGPVPRRFLEAFDGPSALPIDGSSGRLELAERLTSPDDPLPARVLVNRVWHHLLGRGLVASVDDFGAMGDAPTHPALLDWLARRFVESGWSMRAVVREVALSSTYRMSSDADPAAAEADPGNRMWHAASIRRLSAEAVRDAILAVSGTLDPTMFGRPVPIHLTRFLGGRGRPGRSGPVDGEGRRSVYLAVRRNYPSPFLRAFDFPPPAQTMGRRSVSNVPAQALSLMNDPFVVGEARRWAEREVEAGGTVPEIVDRMVRRAFARPPSPDEAESAVRFVEAAGGGVDAVADLGHVLFNVKEFAAGRERREGRVAVDHRRKTNSITDRKS